MATVTVSNENQLMAALNNATGDTTILMAKGNYDNLYISGNKIPELSNASTVTLKSADDKNPATITNMIMIGADNVVFDGITFDYTSAPGASVSTRPFMLLSSDNITVKNSSFEGDLAHSVSSTENGFGTGIALGVKDTSNLTVQNNTFSTFHKGVAVQNGVNINVTGNDVSGMASDGLNFQSVTNVLVANNHLHDFAASTTTNAHKDMIQFWARGNNPPSTNVVIKDNILNSGSGTYTQSILIKTENGSLYKDFVVQNNLIHNSFTHGITLDNIKGVVVQNNTVLHNEDSALSGSGLYLPKIHIGSNTKNAVVQDNVAHAITGNTWTGSGNLIVQNTDPAKPNYYADLFVNAQAGANATIADLAPVSGGIIEQNGVGSSLSQAGNGNSLSAGTGQQFSSTNTPVPTVPVADTSTPAPTDTKTKTDTSTPQQPSNSNATTTGPASDIISVDFEKGTGDTSSVPNAATTKGNVKIVTDQGSKVAQLNNNSAIAYKDTPDIYNNKAYTVMADFRKDQTSDEGKLITFSKSFVIQVKDDMLSVSVTTDKGTNWIHTKAPVDDTKWHKIALTFDSQSGKAELYLDGQNVGTVNGLEGATQVGSKSHDFHVGSPFGNSFDGLVDNVTFLTNDLSAAEIKAIHSNGVSTGGGSSGGSNGSANGSNGGSATVPPVADTNASTTTHDDPSHANGSFSYTMTAKNTKVVLDGNAQKGIVDQAYLSGDTASSFKIDVIDTKSTANFKNALGVYEIDKKGNMVDVRIIDNNTTDGGGTITVTGVDKGHDLGFFIVQNGYTRMDKVLGGNDLELVVQKGNVYLANSSGNLTKKVFVSHDKSLNYDNFEHVTSMDNPNSTGAIVTFDDQHKGGRTDDMTDVVFEVTAVNADHLDFA